MQQADFLLTTAEIAIAFAAFASLISVIGGRDSGAAQQIAAMRLLCVLVLALLTAALCLLPFPIREFGLSGSDTFRLSSAIVLVPESVGTFYLVKRAPAGFYSEQFASGLSIGLALVAGVLLLASAGGVFAGSTLSAVYLSLVVLHLVGAGQFFLLVIASVMNPQDG